MAKNIKPKKNVTETPKKDSQKKHDLEIANITPDFKYNLSISIVSAFSSLVVIYWVCNLIYNNYKPNVEDIINEASKISVLGNYGFAPEPVERLQYIVSLLLLPLLLFGFHKTIPVFVKNIDKYFTIILAISIIILTVISFNIFSEQNIVLDKDKNTLAFFHQTILGKNLIFFLLSIPASILLLKLSKKKKIATFVFGIIATIIVCIIFILNLFEIDNYPGAYLNLNPVLYPVTQVFQNKTILVHLSSQYGLYPEFLNIIFKIVGLSVHKFSLVFSFITSISFVFIYLFLNDSLKNKIVGLFTFCTLFFMSFINVRLLDGHDAYFQFWAIRILFTYLICLIASKYSKNYKLFIPYVLLNSIAFYWNIDTGLICLVACLFHILYLKIADEKEINLLELIKTTSNFVGIFITTSILFILYLYIKSGSMPDLAIMFKSQNLFYIAGFFMLPMPAFHFWWLVIIIYVIALSYSLLKLIRFTAEKRDSIYFLLSLLGLGVFSYYQGRSHDFVLTGVYYPAIFILGLACDDLIDEYSFSKINAKSILGVSLFLILSISFYSAFTVNDFIIENINRKPNSSSFNPTENLKANINFINSNFSKKDSVLVLSRNLESVYYAECDLINPLNLSSSTEIILKTDEEIIKQFLLKNTKHKIILDNNAPSIFKINSILLNNYKIEKATPNNALLVMSPIINSTSVQKNNNDIIFENLEPFTKKQLVIDTINFSNKFKLNITFTDFGKNPEGSVVTGNLPGTKNFSGFTIQKTKSDSTYIFAYGDGTKWFQGIPFTASLNSPTMLDISYDNMNIIFVANNKLIFNGYTGVQLKNSDTPLVFNYNFNGVIKSFTLKNTN